MSEAISDAGHVPASFDQLALAAPLLRAIAETGYTRPTPIQGKAIPLVLAGGDLLAAAQTGTGKTAAFTLPILQRLHGGSTASRAGRPRCLILTPTRELAAQVQESVQTYGKYLSLKSMVMFGGVGINPQIEALRQRVDIVVATPGRLLDHAGQRTIDLSGIEILVLDEADRMLDMGFIHDIRKVLALLPAKRQNLLFSATFSDEIRALADRLLQQPGYVEAERRNTTSTQVEQSMHLVEQSLKREVLAWLIRQQQWQQVLVFTRTKHGANRLAEYLDKQGIRAAAIHGNKSQSARTRALADFKASAVTVLVATDIAARGLDIEQLPQVVNFELPNVAEDYVHRIGRTGRAGASGKAVSLVDQTELKLLKAIEQLTRKPVARLPLDGFVAAPAVAAAARPREVVPPQRGSGRAGSGRPAAARQPEGAAHTQSSRRPSEPRARAAQSESGNRRRQPATASGAPSRAAARPGPAPASAPRQQQAPAAPPVERPRSSAPRAALFLPRD